jgi:hypothetical protein
VAADQLVPFVSGPLDHPFQEDSEMSRSSPERADFAGRVRDSAQQYTGIVQSAGAAAGRAMLLVLAVLGIGLMGQAQERKPVAKKETGKPPIPDERALARADETVREKFRAEYEQLGRKLLEEAKATAKDAGRRYVLLARALSLGMHGGNLDLALTVIDTMAKYYEIDEPGMKIAILKSYDFEVLRTRSGSRLRVGPPGNGSRLPVLARVALLVGDRAIAREKYDVALRLVALAGSAIAREEKEKKGKDFEWRGKSLAEIKDQYQQLAAAGKKLVLERQDVEANLLLGSFLCLELGAWSEGLPRLAQGSDPALKALALEDLKKQKNIAAQVALADRWWDLALKASGPQRRFLMHRATYWYLQVARAEMKEATLAKETLTRIHKRIDELMKVYPQARLDRKALLTRKELPPLTVTDIDTDPELDINFDSKRLEDISVPSSVNPDDPIGIEGAKDDPLTTIPPPKGLGDGTGKGIEGGASGIGAWKPLTGTFLGRKGAARAKLLALGGGNKASEAAVALGLEWIAKHQAPDGHWSLNGFQRAAKCTCGNRGSSHTDIAGTAFGLLPLLGAGYAHQPGKDNPYHKNIRAGLRYLMRKQQQQRTGDFGGAGEVGGTMYSHGLATIAMCEAYGLTQDPNLKRCAQRAIDYVVFAQHEGGGWRYGPKQKGDTSVTGWEIMALKTAQMAGLNVPARTMKKAQDYLDGCMSDTDYGYGYFGKGSTPTMSAVGLLCRQYLQGWGPASPRMAKAVNNWLMPYLPASGKNMYYYYYATQVLHHFGGKSWDKWNVKMRDALIKEQDKGTIPRHLHQKGSWSPVGDPHGDVGGRLMITSLSILALEVYYRHLPLFRGKIAEKEEKKKEDANQKK